MIRNLLFSLSDLKLFHPVENIGDILFKAAFGFLFVFVGITLLIAIFSLLGYVMKKLNARKARKKEDVKPALEQREETEVRPAVGTEQDPAVIAVISAAIAAYYAAENRKCDFVVRRIKRL